MLGINDLQPGVRLRYNGKPYEIVKSEHIKMAQSHGIQRVRMRNLLDGSALDETFKGNQTLEEIDLERKKAQFLYKDDSGCHFMDPASFEQFSIKKTDKSAYLKEGQEYAIIYLDGEPLDVELPTKVTLKVTQAPPGIRGDRSSAGTKQIVLENGITINAPLHIKQGEQIIVDTRTGGYVSRG